MTLLKFKSLKQIYICYNEMSNPSVFANNLIELYSMYPETISVTHMQY